MSQETMQHTMKFAIAALDGKEELPKYFIQQIQIMIQEIDRLTNHVQVLTESNQRQSDFIDELNRQLNVKDEEIKKLKGSPKVDCWGCRENQPNQLAHMNVGGCLYQEEEEFE